MSHNIALHILTTLAETQGFEILNRGGVDNYDFWTLSSPQEDEPFRIRIADLKKHYRAGTIITKPRFEDNPKFKKFMDSSNMTMHYTKDDGYLIACNDCDLTYHYKGNFRCPYTCFCKRATSPVRTFYETR